MAQLLVMDWGFRRPHFYRWSRRCRFCRVQFSYKSRAENFATGPPIGLSGATNGFAMVNGCTGSEMPFLDHISQGRLVPISAQRPPSAVGGLTCLLGLLSLAGFMIVAKIGSFEPRVAALGALLATALPMVISTILVEKAHLRPSTGLDFSLRRPAADVWLIMRTKLAGLAGTLAIMAAFYFALRIYGQRPYRFYFISLALL